MSQERTPSTPGATPGTGTPGASGTGAGVQVQGPNDPYTPAPETGNQGDGGQSATDGQDAARQRNRDEALSRMARERDEARQALEDERRKALPDEERKRLEALDAKTKQYDSERKTLILKYEIAARAPKMGIIDPELAVLVLERSPDITVDDAGTVTGLDEALAKFVKERPHLVRKVEPVDGGAGSGGPRTGGRPSMNDIIRGKTRGT